MRDGSREKGKATQAPDRKTWKTSFYQEVELS